MSYCRDVVEAIERKMGLEASVEVWFVIPLNGKRVQLGKVESNWALNKWDWDHVVHVMQLRRTGGAHAKIM